MILTIVAAVAENMVIGRDLELPWHLPADLKHFKTLTSGNTVVMGRKTFDSCDRKPLPNRRNVVITRNPDYRAAGAEMVPSFEAALQLVAGDEQVFIVGGSAIYGLALGVADRMELTRVHASPEGNVFFPEYAAPEWELVRSERHEADERHAHAFTFQTFERNRNEPDSVVPPSLPTGLSLE